MPENNLKITKEWILKAQNDLKTTEILYKENGPTDSLCFRREFPKVHDLIHLLNLCKRADKNLENLEEDVSFLNRYYIETRYPPEVIAYSKEECKKSLEIARKLTQFIINKILK